ncbi:MAG: hypothetical protein ACOVOV_17740 [Dolichospermum sp.]
MKINDILNKKIDSKTLFEVFLGAPLKAVWDMFNRKVVKESNTSNTNIVYDVRRSQPVVIKSEKIMSQYDKMYGAGEAMRPGFALDSVKYGIKKEICDQIMRSDLFEWQIEETAMGTRVAARLIVNNFQK